jgi:extracellular factor (EF) 3-hydroxypalmitic acid methyl ester biosynthesis protein
MNVIRPRRTSSIPPALTVSPASSHPPSGPRPPQRSSFPPPRHEQLKGASDANVRFRPTRLDPAALLAPLTCEFSCDGASVGPLAILDLSASGFAAAVDPALALTPGSTLESLSLATGGRRIWEGAAVVVHINGDRIGARFTSGVLDIEQLRLGVTLQERVFAHREHREHLPSEWRAAVADARILLEDARFEVEEIESSDAFDPTRPRADEAKLLEGLLAVWAPTFFGRLVELHELSRGFDSRTAALGRSYAASMLMPMLMPGLFYRRAYEKPLGYAGDYRMMEICLAPEFRGDTLYARFLDALLKNSAIPRAVIAREVVLRRAAQQAARRPGTGPVRILSLAAGPAIELRNLLEEMTALDRPLELILLDQDRAAHESAHANLTRVLLERHRGMLPVSVRCLHFSIRQLLNPRSQEETAVVEGLSDLDLIYSAGLYDYLSQPVAVALTRLLYSLLRPAGRLLLGNIVETPESTWFMEYVLAWTAIYRTDDTMLQLAEGLSPAPATEITRDATGRAIFLDATKPAAD